MKSNGWSIDKYENRIHRVNGVIHREDGPAIEYANGAKEWWLNGKKHRIDGAAIEHINIRDPFEGKVYTAKEWWVNGVNIYVESDEEFFRLMKLREFW